MVAETDTLYPFSATSKPFAWQMDDVPEPPPLMHPYHDDCDVGIKDPPSDPPRFAPTSADEEPRS